MVRKLNGLRAQIVGYVSFRLHIDTLPAKLTGFSVSDSGASLLSQSRGHMTPGLVTPARYFWLL